MCPPTGKMKNNLDNENSNDGLQTADSLKPKKRFKKDLNEVEKKIIECVEKDLVENLEEKAAKANLSAKNVKNIIKEVITNEDVLAYVRSAENPEDNNEPVYEPKYTRAKTKQLLSTNTQNILPWASPPKTPSVVHMLFNEELQEDSSGDEYVPENQSNKSLCENSLDVLQSSSKKKANIALRTRSKLSLSHTPLEVIEEAFMPPDITTDMYNMDCDDDVWKEFLKTFTRPLDEVTKAAEDEDHDPEYNVLADEEIDEVDKEELRADRAVTVSRKEFNCLMAELFEFADIYESNKLNEKSSTEEISVKNFEEPQEVQNVVSDVENEQDILIKEYQVAILAQQMRQHVQMLTHNYLLAYENPEFSDLAIKFKEMLMDIKIESEGKEASIYHAINLNGALELIANWEHLFATGSKEALECKKYVEKVMAESIQARAAGTTYIVSFPPLVLKTISNSKVFIYPNLLPRIPFRSTNVTRTAYYFFTRSEENLIALFIEQALHYLKNDPFHLTKWKKVNMEHVWELIHRLLMPHVDPAKMRQYVIKKKRPTSEENPIKYFYRTKKAPPIVHYVTQLDENSIVPPCKRSPETLPYQWRQYLYPNYEEEKRKIIQQQNYNLNDQTIIISPSFQIWPVFATNSVPAYNINFAKRVIVQRRAVGQRRTVLKQSAQPTVKKVQKVKQNNIKKTKIPEDNNNISTLINKQTDKMLPDMPNLGATPMKNTQNLDAQQTASKQSDANASSNKEQNLSFKNITTSLNFQFYKPESNSEVRRNFEGISAASTSVAEKDNPDDINELMRASSTVKTVPRKEPSGAEKKRAKLRREFLANLVMATPDDPEVQSQKEENFADSFFDKLRQTLTTDDYNKIIDILAHYDETNGDFVEFYNNVLSVLLPNYKELLEEFLLFFTSIQASKVGQLMPYFVMKDMDRFMKKLQVYFKDQPSQMKKIIKCLTDLSENPNLTIDIMKTTILPLFKGNAALTDWFLQIFPCEKPPNLLTSGPHEAIDISKELARPPDEDICETVVLPDTEDPYGGPTCICTCHNVENPQFNSRTQHCKKCGLKFIQGKIYIQTGKALRPAVVSFLTNPEKDHTKRLSAEQRKRSETSPSKQVTSPNKENQTHEEPRHSNESDDECDGGKKKNQRSAKTQKRKVKHCEKNVTKDSGKKNQKEVANSCDKVKSDNAKSSRKSPKRQTKKRNITTKKTPEHKPGSNIGQQKRLAEEPEEPAELVELKVNSDHSGDSECEFCDSSQDSDDSSASASKNHHTNDGSKEVPWTREEDKIILQAIRQRNDNEATFKHISEILENRSLLEIKNRFHKLMSLLQQMAAK